MKRDSANPENYAAPTLSHAQITRALHSLHCFNKKEHTKKRTWMNRIFWRKRKKSLVHFLIGTGDGGFLRELCLWGLNLEALMMCLEVVGQGFGDLVKRLENF
jgi:hypothetical protein